MLHLPQVRGHAGVQAMLQSRPRMRLRLKVEALLLSASALSSSHLLFLAPFLLSDVTSQSHERDIVIDVPSLQIPAPLLPPAPPRDLGSQKHLSDFELENFEVIWAQVFCSKIEKLSSR